MQLRLPFGPEKPGRRDRRPGERGRQPAIPVHETLVVGRSTLAVNYVRHRRARHYVLRVNDDGSVRVTVPRGGTRAEADRFVREKARWIERERYSAAVRAARQRGEATSLMVRGVECPIAVEDGADGRVARAGGVAVALRADAGPLGAIERQLRRVASVELPRRLADLAAEHGRIVSGVSVRGQRTRWGSCSPSGRISLNWRLVQLPPSVCDYILLHELAHLRHLNHSKRFWQEVERTCPWHREARAWLKSNGRRLQLA